MSWSVPPTFVTGSVVSAAQLNILSNDLSDLDSRTQPQTAAITSTDTTTSTTYTDLGHVGPAVTLTTGTAVMVALYANASNNTAGAGASMAVAVSGATTVAAPAGGVVADFNSLPAGQIMPLGATFLITGLTPGSNTFTCKYAAASAGTATFYGSPGRYLVVWPANKLS